MDHKFLTDNYVYDNGKLYNRKGKIIGWTDSNGYRKCTINKITYYLHRVIYFFHHAVWPDVCDHINRNKSDNRIENLRSVTFTENLMNTDAKITNKLGLKNISWHKASKRWRVQICRNYKVIDIGYFSCLARAVAARQQLKEC